MGILFIYLFIHSFFLRAFACFVMLEYIYRLSPNLFFQFFFFPPKGLAALKIQVAVVCSGLASQYDLYFAVSEVLG